MGDKSQISTEIDELILRNEEVWVEVEYLDDEILPSLGRDLMKKIDGSRVEILRVKNQRAGLLALSSIDSELELGSFTHLEIFDEWLKSNEIKEDQAQILKSIYKDIVSDLFEDDVMGD